MPKARRQPTAPLTIEQMRAKIAPSIGASEASINDPEKWPQERREEALKSALSDRTVLRDIRRNRRSLKQALKRSEGPSERAAMHGAYEAGQADLNGNRAAKVYRVASERTVRRWWKGEQDIPGPVVVLTQILISSSDARKLLGLELAE